MKYKSESLEEIHMTAKELYDCGVIPKFTMDFFDARCLAKKDYLANSLFKGVIEAIDFSEIAHGYIVHEVSKDEEGNTVIKQVKRGEYEK